VFEIHKITIVIITTYRSPTGNCIYFLSKLESLWIYHIQKNEFIIYGDININYLASHNRRQKLDTLLVVYNLNSTVSFPTRSFNVSSTAIENIFIDL